MSEFQRPPKKKIRIFPLVLLALVCVFGAELTASYFYAPELFEQLTAPFRSGAAHLASTGEALLDRLSQVTMASAPPQDAEEADSQQVGEPAESPPIPVNESVTQLIYRDGSFYLTGGAHEVSYYNQTDERWSQVPYGTDPLKDYGCGPTAMAMAVATLTDTSTDPEKMAAWAAEQGYWAKGQGSYLTIVPGAARTFGLSCTPIPTTSINPDDLLQRLMGGEIAVALMSKGHFTNNGHFILLRGVTLDGQVLVADSASPERSLTPWDLDLILDELASRRNSASLWMVSSPESTLS